jgi:hypothetical protein
MAAVSASRPEGGTDGADDAVVGGGAVVVGRVAETGSAAEVAAAELPNIHPDIFESR